MNQPLAAILACCTLLGAFPATAGTLTVAQSAPLTGPLAPTGTHMQAGIKLYFSRVNDAGGIHGNTLQLVTRDDGYKATKTVTQTEALIKEVRPIAFAGVVGTGNVTALVKQGILAKAGIPLVGFRSGATALVLPANPWLFSTRATYANEVRKIVGQLAATGARDIGVFYQDDAFGKDGLQAAEIALKAAGLNLVAHGGYTKNTTDVAAAVATLSEKSPQAIIMVSNTAASSAFVKAFRETGQLAQLFAVSVTDGPQVAKRIGNPLAHGLAVTQVVPDPNNRAMRLAKELQEDLAKYGEQLDGEVSLNHTLLEGYICGRVLAEGLRRTGPNPTPAKLRNALEAISDFDAGGVFISYSPDRHDGSRFVELTILNKHGKLLR